MNIFFLDEDTRRCAEYHADRHVVKMVCETTQILSTVLYKNGIIYGTKPTHENHPSVLWAGLNLDNFKWLKSLGIELAKEYYFRYGLRKSPEQYHKYTEVLENMPCPDLPSIGEVKMEMKYCAIGDEYRNKFNNHIEAYREYYLKEKENVWHHKTEEKFNYKFRIVPEFILEYYENKIKIKKEDLIKKSDKIKEILSSFNIKLLEIDELIYYNISRNLPELYIRIYDINFCVQLFFDYKLNKNETEIIVKIIPRENNIGMNTNIYKKIHLTHKSYKEKQYKSSIIEHTINKFSEKLTIEISKMYANLIDTI